MPNVIPTHAPTPLLRSLLVVLLWLFACGISQRLSAAETDFRASLTAEENRWLQTHADIRFVCDPDTAPLEFVDEQGNYQGIGADILKLVADKLKVRFVRVETKSFYESLQKLREGQADVLPLLADTPQRREYLIFTAPYMQFPSVVITARKDIETWGDEVLRSLKIAVVHGYYTEDWLTREYPETELIRTPDNETALLNTSFGLADVMVGNLASFTYLIDKMKIANLRVARQLDQNLDAAMAVRRDLPLLRSILDKALASISEEEKQAISKRWIRLEAPVLWRNPQLRLAALGVLSLLVLTIVATLVWNRALARKVRQRTAALEEAHLRLMQTAKLESVGRLAAGVAHEVKNPLAIIQMGLDYLQAETAPESEAGLAIQDMEDAVQRADGVVKGLLDFSRERKLDMRPIELNDVVRESIKLVQHELNQHNITIRQALYPPGLTTHGDPDKLKQVLINLFMNAIQAMGKNGTLSVQSQTLRLKKADKAGLLAGDKFAVGDSLALIKVEDTGPGIDPAKVGKVFDPFFTTKPIGQGTGLGLSVSRNIIELHGGIIQLGNRQGGGAAATLMFKLAKA